MSEPVIPNDSGLLKPSEAQLARGDRVWRRLGIGFLAFVALAVVSMALWQAVDPESYARFQAAQEAERADRAEREARVQRAAVGVFALALRGEIEGCERGATGLAQAMGQGAGLANRIEIYRLAQEVDFTCGQRSTALRRIDLPDAEEALRDLAQAAREACSSALTMKSASAAAIARVADRGARVAAMAEAESLAGMAERATRECAGELDRLDAALAPA